MVRALVETAFVHGFEQPVFPIRSIAASDIAVFVDAVPSREVRCLFGVDHEGLADRLASGPPPRRPVLHIDLAGPRDTAAFVERAVGGLARAVASLWPHLWGGEDLSALRDDPLSLAHLQLRLEELALRKPTLSRAWAGEIVPRLGPSGDARRGRGARQGRLRGHRLAVSAALAPGMCARP